MCTKFGPYHTTGSKVTCTGQTDKQTQRQTDFYNTCSLIIWRPWPSMLISEIYFVDSLLAMVNSQFSIEWLWKNFPILIVKLKDFSILRLNIWPKTRFYEIFDFFQQYLLLRGSSKPWALLLTLIHLRRLGFHFQTTLLYWQALLIEAKGDSCH